MKTKGVTLYYKVTPTEVHEPNLKDKERKERWVKDIQRTVPSEFEYQIIRVDYQLFNPEVENQRKFFHTCVLYYAIQDMDMTEGVPDSATLRRYREEILDDMLGYDVRLIKRVIRRRTSTSDFKTVERWSRFLRELEEEQFANAGYIFPDSTWYWELVRTYGHQDAKRIAVEKLQERIKKLHE